MEGRDELGASTRKFDRGWWRRPLERMVDKQIVRIGTVIGSALVLVMACSSRTVDLNKTGNHEKNDGAVGNDGGAHQTDDGGAGGPTQTDGGLGAGGAGGSALDATTGTHGEDPNLPSTVKKSQKLDLLLMVDNSISMADKQDALSRSIPDLVQRISTSSSGFTDLHVGVITSSIGGHGSNLCAGSDTTGNIEDQEQNDHGYLIGTRPRFSTAKYPDALKPTAEGFLAWTPDMGAAGLVSGIRAMVESADEFGCGLESQLEAVQRFLVDPQPYKTLVVQNCAPGTTEPCAVPTGVDTTLLAQRAAFLRPDSVVAIVELTDENDCSIQESGQYYYAARDEIVLPHGSTVCLTNPNDPCCYFCNASPPTGCTPDPICTSPLTPTQDPPNLRCFHQKERFGFDFLYPVERYINALSRTQICTSRADLATDPLGCKDSDGDKRPDVFNNPLFVNGNTVRDPSMVYFLGIVGVPYQDLAVSSGAGTLVYQTPAELVSKHTWDKVLGNDAPGNSAPPILPTDNLMVESVGPRGGDDGESPPAPLASTTGGSLANPVNGHEWVNSDESDLQYACIFPLAETRDCAKIVGLNPEPGCDCKPSSLALADDNPLCQDSSGKYSTTQGFGKAYPALRELSVVKALGNNGLASSICSGNLSDDSKDDFGYRPAIDLMLNQIAKSAP
jgi:hypothetical protein